MCVRLIGNDSKLVNVELEMKRESKSINIDPELWRELRKTAIDLNVSASDLFEEAIREKLARVKKK
jgi:DNA-binding protein YbaB